MPLVFTTEAMRYEEFQRHIGKAGLTLSEFAELICMNRVSISNLKRSGQVPSHLAIIACLLGEMGERRIEFRSLIKGIGLAPKRPRGATAEGRFGGNLQGDFFANAGERRSHSTLSPEKEHNKNKREA